MRLRKIEVEKDKKEDVITEISYWKQEEDRYSIQIEWVTPKGKKRACVRAGNLKMVKEYGKLYGVKPRKA